MKTDSRKATQLRKVLLTLEKLKQQIGSIFPGWIYPLNMVISFVEKNLKKEMFKRLANSRVSGNYRSTVEENT